MLNTKNIIISVAIVITLVLVYFFFIKTSPDTNALISVTPLSVSNTATPVGDGSVANDFLTLLLNVKNIKLNDAILSDNAFTSLRDSSITLTADGTEGRPNPFAPLGVDNIIPTEPLSVPPVATPTLPVVDTAMTP